MVSRRGRLVLGIDEADAAILVIVQRLHKYMPSVN